MCPRFMVIIYSYIQNRPKAVKTDSYPPLSAFYTLFNMILESCRKLCRRGALLVLLAALAGCKAPIGADRVPTRAAYAQVEANALSAGRPSSSTESILHRYDVDAIFHEDPEKAVTELHFRAVANNERDLLYALAEVSFTAAEAVEKSVKPWDTRDARDYYLATAVYAWLFLFGEADTPTPSPFDRRFRSACDLYNHGLGLAFSDPKGTNAVARFDSGKRRLPVGNLDIRIDVSQMPWQLSEFDQFLLADQFKVRGLSTRIRQPGLGAALIGKRHRNVGAGIRPMVPVTAFLRIDGSLKTLAAGAGGVLEFHSGFGPGTVTVANQTVPLETDVTAQMAYGLNQSAAWRIERLQFLSLQELIPTDVYLSQPYEKGRIPVVFVHGTFSSPVWWAEMLNALRADPTLRQRYQFWYFIYNSSYPVPVSANRLRKAITARLKELDPQGTDAALQQMVLIGHSQGGLITKMNVTDTGDKLWKTLSTKPIEELDYTEEQREFARSLVFLKPLPCVRRAVFISTPHRGSYRAGNFVRNLTRRLVSIPKAMMGKAAEFQSLRKQLDLAKEQQGMKLTSLDGMSTKNPLLLTLADIPVAPQIKAHSIIPVKDEGDFRTGSDGVVKYQSAHVDYVESELVVRHNHSCQGTPAAIEEVRRILREHLAAQPSTKPDRRVAQSPAE